MKEKPGLDRRDFLKQAAGAVGAVTQAKHWAPPATAQDSHGNQDSKVHTTIWTIRVGLAGVNCA